MLNIVIPMAGHGSRFTAAGYALPKPLIPLHGVSMIETVIANLAPRRRHHRFLFLVQRVHCERYGLDDRLRDAAPGCEILTVDEVTAGAACTVLLARRMIDSAEPLMIANCDQWIDADIDDYLDAVDGLDGLIMTMHAEGEKWSYVRTGDDGLVEAVAEKQPISDQATVGIYNFARGADYVAAADAMIGRGLTVNGEYYVAPVYQLFVEAGARVGTWSVGAVDDGMYGLGTPEDLERFLDMEVSLRAADPARP